MIIAGIGCRRGVPAEAIVALVRQAGGADALAAPAWKQDEPGLIEAARVLGMPLQFVDDAALAAVQAQCPTRSAMVARITGHASVAEAAALAGGGRLVLARIGAGWATCALAERPSPSLQGHSTCCAGGTLRPFRPLPEGEDSSPSPLPLGEGRGERQPPQ